MDDSAFVDDHQGLSTIAYRHPELTVSIATKTAKSIAVAFACILLSLAVDSIAQDQLTQTLEDEVRATESAFAKTMADRNLEAFSAFLSPEVVFVESSSLRGAKAVTEAWSRFFTTEVAPFSWQPEFVSVLDSGELAFSSGPVHDSEGNRIGTFNSVWHRETDGRWLIVFDRGCP